MAEGAIYPAISSNLAGPPCRSTVLPMAACRPADASAQPDILYSQYDKKSNPNCRRNAFCGHAHDPARLIFFMRWHKMVRKPHYEKGKEANRHEKAFSPAGVPVSAGKRLPQRAGRPNSFFNPPQRRRIPPPLPLRPKRQKRLRCRLRRPSACLRLATRESSATPRRTPIPVKFIRLAPSKTILLPSLLRGSIIFAPIPPGNSALPCPWAAGAYCRTPRLIR